MSRSRRTTPLALREQTDDLQQQVAIRLLTELPKHEWRNRGAFGAWIEKLAEAEVIDVHRDHKAQKRDRGVETEVHTASRRPLPTPFPLVLFCEDLILARERRGPDASAFEVTD